MLSMPALCWLCKLPLRIAHHGLCNLCLRQLPALPQLCPRCRLPAGNLRLPCGRCLLKPPPWQALICVGDYRPPLSLWVKQLKFSRVTTLRVMLARLLLLSWQNVYRRGNVPRPDLLLSVPLHPLRRWLRGYNQTDLLAAPLAHWLDCEQGIGLHRQLDARQRRSNLRGAFRLEMAVCGRHIALLDDVVTTGSTVEEISRLLLAQGAVSVQIWCLCRTL